MLEEYLKKINFKNILVIFPHPDDESYATGLLLQLSKKLGLKTNVLILTKGENGSINRKGDRLGDIRVKELTEASKILQVDNLVVGNFKDAGLKEKTEELTVYIKTQIDIIKPDLVVTYDHGGFTGHPDHIATSVVVLDICKPENIPLLFYTPVGLNRVMNKNLAEKYNSAPNYVVKPNLNFNKVRAFFRHRSQVSKFGFLFKVLLLLFIFISSEAYHLVEYSKEYQYEYFPFKID